MSAPNKALKMDGWAIPANLQAQVLQARAKVYGLNGENPEDATQAQKDLVARFEFLNAAEKRAAEEAHAAGRPLPAAVQARINGTARPAAAAPRSEPERRETPPPVIPAIAAPVAIRNNDLKTDYNTLRTRIDTAMRTLRAQEQADKDKGAQATRSPAEYAVIYTLMSRISENVNEVYGKLDTEVSKTGVTPQQLQIANQFSDAYLARLTTQIGEVENRSRANPGDPFDATKFFDDNIKPTLLLASTTMGEMTRKGWDALTTGLGVMGRGIAGAVTDPAGTARGVAAGIDGASRTFMSNLNPGSITGGLLGGLGGFLVSSMFGSGPIKWLLMLLLIPAGMMLGSSKLGGPINNMFSGLFGGRRREGGAPAPETQIDAPSRDRDVRDGRDRRDADARNAEPWSQSWDSENFRPMSREELRRVVPRSVASSTRYDPDFTEQVFVSAYDEGYLDARRGDARRRDGYIAGDRPEPRDGHDFEPRDVRGDDRREPPRRSSDRRDSRSDIEIDTRGNRFEVSTEYGSYRQYDHVRGAGVNWRPR